MTRWCPCRRPQRCLPLPPGETAKRTRQQSAAYETCPARRARFQAVGWARLLRECRRWARPPPGGGILYPHGSKLWSIPDQANTLRVEHLRILELGPARQDLCWQGRSHSNRRPFLKHRFPHFRQCRNGLNGSSAWSLAPGRRDWRVRRSTRVTRDPPPT